MEIRVARKKNEFAQPDNQSIFCPICGETLCSFDQICRIGREVVGCSHCVKCVDADDWAADQRGEVW